MSTSGRIYDEIYAAYSSGTFKTIFYETEISYSDTFYQQIIVVVGTILPHSDDDHQLGGGLYEEERWYQGVIR